MKVHSSGTITQSTTTSWLPVADNPSVSQLCLIWTFSRGITAMRGRPEEEPPSKRMPAPIRLAPMHPEQ